MCQTARLYLISHIGFDTLSLQGEFNRTVANLKSLTLYSVLLRSHSWWIQRVGKSHLIHLPIAERDLTT